MTDHPKRARCIHGAVWAWHRGAYRIGTFKRPSFRSLAELEACHGPLTPVTAECLVDEVAR